MSLPVEFALYLVPRVFLGLCAVLLAAESLAGVSARLRHTLLASGLLAAFLMPVLGGLMPVIEIPVLPDVAEPAAVYPLMASPAVPEPGPAAEPVTASWGALVVVVWLLGLVRAVRRPLAALLRLHRFARGVQRPHPVLAQRFLRRREEMGLRAGRVRLVQSPAIAAPVSWGWHRAVLAFPAGAEDWAAARQDEALVHELAHVQRTDWLLARLADACCALYWFLPPVWMVAARLRLEAERACDEIVLNRGGSRVDYAAHLLELARRERAPAPALLTSHMLGRPVSELGRRVRAILDAEHGRVQMQRKDTCMIAGLCGVLFLALAGVRATAAGGGETVPVAHTAPAPEAPVVAPVPETTVPAAPAPAVAAGVELPSAPPLPALAAASGSPPAPAAPGAESEQEAMLQRELEVLRRERAEIEAQHATLARELERASRERERLHEQQLQLNELRVQLAEELEQARHEQEKARQIMLEQGERLQELHLEREQERQTRARETERRAGESPE